MSDQSNAKSLQTTTEIDMPRVVQELQPKLPRLHSGGLIASARAGRCRLRSNRSRRLASTTIVVAISVLMAACGSSSPNNAYTAAPPNSSTAGASSTSAKSTMPAPQSSSPGTLIASATDLQDSAGYQMNLQYSFYMEPATVSVESDQPGQETVSQSFSDVSVVVTNMMGDRQLDLSRDFDDQLGGMQVGSFWIAGSPVCQVAFPKIPATIPGVGAVCYAAMFNLKTNWIIKEVQQVALSLNNVTGDSSSDPTVSFPGIPQALGDQVRDQLSHGPALWTVSSISGGQAFPSHCVMDGENTFTTMITVLSSPGRPGISCKSS